ncbi:pentatricopeptide repeat-containing protein [Canna indica]|uniref:Pentatricopeptide repeat-containing protein n=1 Tax=Canna indica TaxID=4628 RepID=A0AAQ3JST2_9LILI|nr:pentatricopeptide repeat-containing protein [Canna indica]
MRYLYFEPRRFAATNKAWSSPIHHRVVPLLQSCSTKRQLAQVHAHMLRTRLAEDTFAVSRIIALLASPSALFDMAYARRVFDQIPHPNIFIWNTMIRGYTNDQAPGDALATLKLLLHRAGFAPDSHTFSAVTRACAQLGRLRTGSALHGMATKCGFDMDMFVMSGFISFYNCCGQVDVARQIFDKMPQRDVVSWTSMISGYLQQNRLDEGFRLFGEMRKAGVEPNKITFMSLLSACGQSQALDKGCWLHSQITEYGWENDLDVGNSVVSMYAKCGSTTSAIDAFKNMPATNTATWNALIAGFVHSEHYKEALNMYQEMKSSDARPDEITTAAALSACAQLGDLQQGKLLHAFVEEDNMAVCDTFLGNALMNMYAKCGDLARAEAIFHELPARDVFSWTAMISGYVQGNRCKEALSLFEVMKQSNVKPNEVTLVSLLSACSQLGALDQGRRVHAYIKENEVTEDICLQNALVDMYAKCGCTDVAMQIFDGMPSKDTHTWNAMIGGLAANGHGSEAMSLFNQMRELGGAKPDSVTFMVVLCACSRSGMVKEGLACFDLMSGLYGIVPGVEHYGCLVDLLSRAGFIEEALDLIKKMPAAPNYLIWGCLLAACRIHGKIELAEKIVQNIVELKPDDEGAHVLISNLYAEACRWEEVGQVRALMGREGITKSPGCSSIELGGVAQEFFC